MRLRWPHDGQAVAAGDQVQPCAGAARAQGGVADHPPFHLVAQVAQRLDEVAPVAALVLGVGHQKLIAAFHHLAGVRNAELGFSRGGVRDAIQRDDAARGGIALRNQRGPLHHLLDVLQRDDVGLGLAGPADDDPRERPDFPVAGLAAKDLAVMRAVGRRVEEAHHLAACHGQGIHFADVGTVVPGLRVVDLVHADGIGVVVDGDIDGPADRLLNAGRCAAATGKQVDHQLGSEGQEKLRGEHAAPLNLDQKKPLAAGPGGFGIASVVGGLW